MVSKHSFTLWSFPPQNYEWIPNAYAFHSLWLLQSGSTLIPIKQKVISANRNCSTCHTWQIGITSLGLQGSPNTASSDHCEETEHLREPCQEGTFDTRMYILYRKHNAILRHMIKTEVDQMDHVLKCKQV